MEIRVSNEVTVDSIVDGPGLRTVIWAQGCRHKCPGCHNLDTHKIEGGYLVSADSIIETILKQKYQSGVTFSGGDPFEQPEVFSYIASRLKDNNINLWAYTGYTFEYLLSSLRHRDLLRKLDVLVDGRFEHVLADASLPFRGSSNQRIIDVQKSLKLGSIILVSRYSTSETVEEHHNNLIFAS